MKTVKTVTVLLFLSVIISWLGEIRAVPPCDTAWIIYPDTLICRNAPLQTPFIPGTQGGGFFGTPGLALDSVTGAISPPNSSIGQHSVTYRTSGSCPDTTTLTVSILPVPDPSFLYPGPVCIADPNNPIPSVNTPGGVFKAIGGGIVFADSITGEIELSQSVAGTYLILYVVGNQCPDSAVQVLTILPQASAAFHYPDTVYCQSEPLAAPVIFGQGGGRFWTQTPGVIIDSLTGFIDLPNSSFSWPTIHYRSPAPCPDTASFWMVIAPQGNANFTYAPTSFCTTDPNPLPIISGDTNGTFSCVFGGASVHPNTGEIDLQNSSPGDSILIKYHAPGLTTFCPDSTIIRVRIAAPDTNISVTYPQVAYCQSDPDPVPAIVGPPGGIFGASPGGLIFSSPFSGVVDLSASQPGTYSIQYYPPGTCSDTSGNFALTVLPPPALGLSYPVSEICRCAGPVLPSGLTDSLGQFFIASGSGLALDPQSGAINSDSSIAGSYLIRYQKGGTCPLDTAFSFTVHPQPAPLISSSALRNTICEGEEFDLLGFGADQYEFWYQDSLVRARSANPGFRPGFPVEDGDEFRIVGFNLAGDCEARDSLQIRVISPPYIVSLSYPRTVSSGVPFQINAELSGDSLELALGREGSPALQIPPLKQQVVFSHTAFFSLQETLILQDPTTIGTFLLSLRPLAGDCPGPADTIQVTVLPTESKIFIPGLITPNGDGRNDVWEIRTHDDLDPSLYRIRVLNRSGGEAYRQEGLLPGWNAAGLPDGVYWYVVEDLSGNPIRNGGLTIRRR